MDYALIWLALSVGIFGAISFVLAYFTHKTIFYLIASLLFLLAGVIWLWKTRVLFESALLGIASIISFSKWRVDREANS